MRAMADNKDLALVTGIPAERVVTATWIIGGGLAGASGYLYVLLRGTIQFDFGWLLLLLIFAAVILGGIGSVYGAIAGGLVIGIVFTTSTVWIPSDFNQAAAFAVMITMLLLRPEGLFGGVFRPHERRVVAVDRRAAGERDCRPDRRRPAERPRARDRDAASSTSPRPCSPSPTASTASSG